MALKNINDRTNKGQRRGTQAKPKSKMRLVYALASLTVSGQSAVPSTEPTFDSGCLLVSGSSTSSMLHAPAHSMHSCKM